MSAADQQSLITSVGGVTEPSEAKGASDASDIDGLLARLSGQFGSVELGETTFPPLSQVPPVAGAPVAVSPVAGAPAVVAPAADPTIALMLEAEAEPMVCAEAVPPATASVTWADVLEDAE